MNRRHFLKRGTLGASAIGWAQVIATGTFAAQPQNMLAGDPSSGQDRSHSQQEMHAGNIQLHDAIVVSRPGKLPFAEQTAAKVLVEEVEKRTGIRLGASTVWPAGKAVIAITSGQKAREWGRHLPSRQGARVPEKSPEGYRLYVDSRNGPPVVWVIGADARGYIG